MQLFKIPQRNVTKSGLDSLPLLAAPLSSGLQPRGVRVRSRVLDLIRVTDSAVESIVLPPFSRLHLLLWLKLTHLSGSSVKLTLVTTRDLLPVLGPKPEVNKSLRTQPEVLLYSPPICSGIVPFEPGVGMIATSKLEPVCQWVNKKLDSAFPDKKITTFSLFHFLVFCSFKNVFVLSLGRIWI